MNKKKVIDYIDSLEQQAKESNRFFKERNELYIENTNLKQALNKIRKIINESEEFGYVKSVTKDVQEDILQIINEAIGDDDSENS